MLFFILMLVVNFAISWSNAHCVGKYWSESKEIGGYIRFSAIIGYILAIIGFTLVYGCLLLLAFPYVAPLIPALQNVDTAEVMQLTSDLLFLLIGTAIVPIGFLVWFQSIVAFWRNKTFGNGARAAWNTYAHVRNTITYAREAPSAFGRIVEVLFGGKSKKKKGNEVLILAAILIIIMAALGGYFTASAIMKKADREFDAFALN